MQGWTTAAFVLGNPNRPSDLPKVIQGDWIPERLAGTEEKELCRFPAGKAMPLVQVPPQLLSGAGMNRYESRLAELRVADLQSRRIGVQLDVTPSQPKRSPMRKPVQASNPISVSNVICERHPRSHSLRVCRCIRTISSSE